MSLKTSNLPFKARVDHEVHNTIMRKAVVKAQETIGANRQKMVDELGHWEEWRDLSKQIRNHVLANLDAYLYQLSEKVMENGGKVYFAETAEEASAYIRKVALEKNAKKIVKSKSMVTEEIGLNEVLEKEGMQVIETDLGEYLLQISGDKPSHIVVPAIHKDRHQIRKDLSEKLGYEGEETPEDMTRFVREKIRQDFLEADIGISGCNFAVAETGSFQEVDVLITMLARSAVGAKLTGYNTWLTGPRLAGETDGPEEFHLVIVDNGRSDILASEFQEVLRCIRCGACLNTCPAYRQIGGHGYGSIYPGPIGAVISPLLGGYDEFKELPYACSLCNACNSVCPVRIPLAQLILKHREKMVELGKTPAMERLSIFGFTTANANPILWKTGVNIGAKLAGKLIKNGKAPITFGALGEWTKARDLPQADGESFRQWFNNRERG